jgi:formylmethanofuran dehydrogenase subunit D
MRKIGVKEGDTVMVNTDSGSVYVSAVRSLQAPHKGIIFLPMGPWANMVTSANTDSIGMPSFKGIPARVSVAKDKRVLTYPELLKETYGK